MTQTASRTPKIAGNRRVFRLMVSLSGWDESVHRTSLRLAISGTLGLVLCSDQICRPTYSRIPGGLCVPSAFWGLRRGTISLGKASLRVCLSARKRAGLRRKWRNPHSPMEDAISVSCEGIGVGHLKWPSVVTVNLYDEKPAPSRDSARAVAPVRIFAGVIARVSPRSRVCVAVRCPVGPVRRIAPQ